MSVQEYFLIQAEMVLKLPSTINLDQAALIEPLAVGVHAVNRAGPVTGKNVMVLGAGTIGNLVGQAALAKGAKNVLMSDISEYKLEIAKKCRLVCTVNPQKESLEEAILKAFGPDRADIILECVGVEETMSQAIASARKGSIIVVVGVFGKKPTLDIGLVQNKELNVVGSLMYQKEDYEDAIDMVDQGKTNLGPIITNRFPFREFKAAYEFIESSHGNTLKVMVDLE